MRLTANCFISLTNNLQSRKDYISSKSLASFWWVPYCELNAIFQGIGCKYRRRKKWKPRTWLRVLWRRACGQEVVTRLTRKRPFTYDILWLLD